MRDREALQAHRSCDLAQGRAASTHGGNGFLFFGNRDKRRALADAINKETTLVKPRAVSPGRRSNPSPIAVGRGDGLPRRLLGSSQ